MRKGLSLIFSVLLLLGSLSTAQAADSTTTSSVVTLEQAKSLAHENSRTLKQYENNVKKTKYQVQQADYDYDEAIDKYNSIGNSLDSPDVDYDKVWEQLESQGDKIESSSDSVDNAENNYDDAQKEEENYRKQLDYLVEESYTNILNLEDSQKALQKEYQIKQINLTLERKKLLLGSSSQANVDEQSITVSELNKKILDQTNQIKTQKGQLNVMLGRNFGDELSLSPFDVSVQLELPAYEELLSNATSSYELLWQMKRDLNDLDDDLDDLENDSDSYYQSLIIRQDIKNKELELAEQQSKLQETISNLLAEAQTKQEAYQAAQTNYRVSQRAYNWAQKRYELGQTSKLTLLESELDYLNKQIAKDNAGYALFLAKHSLELAEVGIFS